MSDKRDNGGDTGTANDNKTDNAIASHNNATLDVINDQLPRLPLSAQTHLLQQARIWAIATHKGLTIDRVLDHHKVELTATELKTTTLRGRLRKKSLHPRAEIIAQTNLESSIGLEVPALKINQTARQDLAKMWGIAGADRFEDVTRRPQTIVIRKFGEPIGDLPELQEESEDP